MTAEQFTGKVKFFNDSKGWGFITDDGGVEEYFFHVTGTLDKVTKDDKVIFNLESGQKGVKAVNIKKI